MLEISLGLDEQQAGCFIAKLLVEYLQLLNYYRGHNTRKVKIMKIRFKLVSVLLLALSCMNAKATVLTVSTKGTLSGTDYSGWFAAPGTYLDAVDYSMRFSFEFDSRYMSRITSEQDESIYGEAPMLVALTINNKKATLGHQRWGDNINLQIIDGTPNGSFDTFSFSARTGTIYGDPVSRIRQEITSLDSNFVLAHPKLGDVGQYNPLPSESIGSQFLLYDWIQGRHNEFITTITSASVSVHQVDGVIPEPGSFALIGVGLLAAARSRRGTIAK